MTADDRVVKALMPPGPDRMWALLEAIESVFRGKREAVRLTLVALLAEGHVLFEDVPGVGKTTLVRAVARAIGCTFRRVQFTSDLLPSDIVGVSIYDREAGVFAFRPGPVFANVVLADEINRTTPRTQSALLEAMNEGQVTVDDSTHMLPRPFVVLATQNPMEFAGTYPLPESQMDRFMLRVTIGYPDPATEEEVIRTLGMRDASEALTAVVSADEVAAMQAVVREVHGSDPVVTYLRTLVGETRQNPYLDLGVSTRGGISLFHACQAHAWLDGRDHVLPDDVKSLFLPVCAHRVIVRSTRESAVARRAEAEKVLREILETTPLPL